MGDDEGTAPSGTTGKWCLWGAQWQGGIIGAETTGEQNEVSGSE